MRLTHHRYFIPLIFLVIIVLAFILLKSYIIPVLWAIFLSYLFYPVFKLLNKKIKNRDVLATIMCILIAAVILVPLYFLVSLLLKEAFQLYSYVRLSSLVDILAEHNINIAPYIDTGIKRLATLSVETITGFLISVPKRLLDLFIIIFVTFYLFKSGDSFLNKIKKALPTKLKNIVFRDFSKTTHAVVYGHVVTAIVQGGIVGTIGFVIFGIPNPLLWGAVMTFLALIPFLGPAFVWVPAAAIQYFRGNEFAAIGLFIYGLAIISTVDNLIKPKLIGAKAKIHPVVILLGLVGGITAFGLIGIILGPLILALFLSLLKFYMKNEAKG